MKRITSIFTFILCVVFLFGCSYPYYVPPATEAKDTQESSEIPSVSDDGYFDYWDIPKFDGSTPYVVINDNDPFITEEVLVERAYEDYGRLDRLGRCTTAVATVGKELMPAEERGSIGAVKPTGWHTVKYDCVDGMYLYNRCHLIGYQLTGENANEKNLITGTRYMNVQGMLPFENMVADYVKETGNHVFYRVTPIFQTNELVARGVVMEAMSVEDGGEGICFNVFCYNVQPNIEIDYLTGESVYVAPEENGYEDTKKDYVLNVSSKKFHYSTCSSVSDMNDSNKQYYNGTREQLIDDGYAPCGSCKP